MTALLRLPRSWPGPVGSLRRRPGAYTYNPSVHLCEANTGPFTAFFFRELGEIAPGGAQVTFRRRISRIKRRCRVPERSSAAVLFRVWGSPEGGTVTITSLSEAERFYKDAGEIIRQFVRQKPQTDSG